MEPTLSIGETMPPEEAESCCSTGIVSNSSEGSSVVETSRLSCKEGFSDEASKLSVISFSTSSCGSRTGICEVSSGSTGNTSDTTSAATSDAASRGEFELEGPSTTGTRVSSSGDSSTTAVRQETRHRTANKRKKTFFTRASPHSKQKGM